MKSYKVLTQNSVTGAKIMHEVLAHTMRDALELVTSVYGSVNEIMAICEVQ